MYMNKKAMNFTIDPIILENFVKISKKLSINRSQFVENAMNDLVNKNKELLKDGE